MRKKCWKKNNTRNGNVHFESERFFVVFFPILIQIIAFVNLWKFGGHRKLDELFRSRFDYDFAQCLLEREIMIVVDMIWTLTWITTHPITLKGMLLIELWIQLLYAKTEQIRLKLYLEQSSEEYDSIAKVGYRDWHSLRIKALCIKCSDIDRYAVVMDLEIPKQWERPCLRFYYS